MKLPEQAEGIYLLYVLPVQVRLREEREERSKKHQKYLPLVLHPARASCPRLRCRWRAAALMMPIPPKQAALPACGAALFLQQRGLGAPRQPQPPALRAQLKEKLTSLSEVNNTLADLEGKHKLTPEGNFSYPLARS